MDCSLPGSSIHGIFRATVLEWSATAFSPYTIRELQIKKNKQIITTTLSEWPAFKGLTTPNAGKEVNQQELSLLGGGDAKR